MSELDSRFVKRGYWVNLEQGSIMGKTITTDTRTGTVIIALLAVITSIGLKHLWNLLVFSYHQARATGRPSDGLFRQQQVLLRTLPTSSTLIAESLKLWYTWRHVSNRAFTRTLAHSTVSLIFLLGSLAVSIFSSYIVSTSNLEVLVSSPHCGYFRDSFSQGYYASVSTTADTYAQNCFQNVTLLPSRCNVYTRPNVPFSMEMIPCPFDQAICLSDAVAFDSGVVGLNSAIGFNLASKDDVGYRKRTTCAMLNLAGRTKILNYSSLPEGEFSWEPIPGDEYMAFYYGYNKGGGTDATFFYSLGGANHTTQLRHLCVIFVLKYC